MNLRGTWDDTTVVGGLVAPPRKSTDCRQLLRLVFSKGIKGTHPQTVNGSPWLNITGLGFTPPTTKPTTDEVLHVSYPNKLKKKENMQRFVTYRCSDFRPPSILSYAATYLPWYDACAIQRQLSPLSPCP